MKYSKKEKRFSPTQLRMGIAVEKEHRSTINYIKSFQRKFGKFPSNRKIYKRISINHLRENPIYYSKLKELKL